MNRVPTEIVTSCRICAGMCSLRLSRDEDGRIVSAHGDKSNPLTRGYACIKGLQLPAAHASPDRLLPLKRLQGGSFVRVPLDEALDEIAQRLRELIHRHGPDRTAGSSRLARRAGRSLRSSPHGRIEAVVEADDSMRPGVVSISHGWGGLPGDAPDPADPHGAGVNVNRQTATRADLKTLHAMPRLTAIPVRITPLHTRAGFQVSESQHHQRTFPS